MSILWDTLLVSGMARELHDALAGARLRAYYMDREARNLLLFLDDVTLVCRLHPEHGHILARPPRSALKEATSLKGRLLGVRSDRDERILVLELQSSKSQRLNLTLELMSNQWNALLVDVGSRRILRVLRPREAGGRRLIQGSEYAFPEPSKREGKVRPLELDRWLELLLSVPPRERRRALLKGVAFTSSLNAPALLGTAADSDDPEAARSALEEGHELWLRIRGLEDPEPVVLRTDRGPQPYPCSLPGYGAQPVETLAQAMERAAEAQDDSPGSAFMPSELLERLQRGVHRARGKVAQLEKELEGTADPEKVRATGDLILARFHQVPKGREMVELEDFQGEVVRVELSPELSPQENAERYYDEAARAERARKRLPSLVERARRRARRMEEALDQARAGELEPDAVRELAPEPVEGVSGSQDQTRLPYRTYRSSGGLEIRVGRGAKSNDELTFHHSKPDDVWLHARHAAGAHVILRWQEAGSPPKRDLTEAAILAALNSKARTSGSVPVDWTRRKYVRSPRNAGPGTVIPDRVNTVFVKPDPRVEKRLRVVD